MYLYTVLICSLIGCTKADIAFVLDVSGSIGTYNFRKELDFVSTFANALTIGPNDVQISVMTFATRVYEQFSLNTYSNAYSLVNAINRIPYTDGSTITDEALRYSALNLFKSSHGGRTNAPDVLVFVTDGQSNDKYATVQAATLVHHLNIKTWAIGVGQNTDPNELAAIATDSQHVFNVDSYAAMYTLQSELQGKACSGKFNICLIFITLIFNEGHKSA